MSESEKKIGDKHTSGNQHPEGSEQEKPKNLKKEGEKDDKDEQNDVIQSKRRLEAWDYFVEIKGCEVGKEKAKCSLCNVIIKCNKIRNGTGAMMNHLRTSCPTSKLQKNLDNKQKTLQLQAMSKEEMKGGNTHNVKSHSFNQEKLRKKLAMMCIKDNQSFRIVEHEGFRELLNEAEPKFKMPSRWTVARDCLKFKMVCLDVDTRWNSTYTMLEVAVKYEGAFLRMIMEDPDYEAFFKINEVETAGDITRKKKKKKKMVEGAPLHVDFANVNRFIQFLKIFYDVTLKLSGSRYSTSNVFFVELVKVQESIIKLCSSEDLLMKEMAKRMKDKYGKYWDNVDNTNFLLYVAVVLDPRYKLSFVEFCFSKIHGRGSTKCALMCDKVMKTLQELFDYYKKLGGHVDPSSNSNIEQSHDSWEDDYENFMKDQSQEKMGKSGIDLYLLDDRERKSEGFDILGWWKKYSTKFPILSTIARHVLGMPVASVASEAAFSTGGRTIDAYRSSLSPKMAEALVCSQDWLRNYETVIDLRGEPEEYLHLEKLENDELKTVGKLVGECSLDD